MVALANPVKLGPLTLKNRIFMSALTRSRAVPTNVPNELMAEYYKQRSGAGLIVTEGVLITQQGSVQHRLLKLTILLDRANQNGMA
jgi:2,4-dienoyl-CoA reductase-like NADH-dependent reductase (Old Yellow Enzyme family)